MSQVCSKKARVKMARRKIVRVEGEEQGFKEILGGRGGICCRIIKYLRIQDNSGRISEADFVKFLLKYGRITTKVI